MDAINHSFSSKLSKAIFTTAGLILFGISSHAATIVWNGASGTDTNWSNANNWVGGIAPGGSDDVKFFDAGATNAAAVVDNVMDSGFGGTVASLQYGNTNGFHTTLIPSGSTLNVTGAGGLTAGTLTDNGSAQIVTATVTGAGMLNLNNSAALLLANQGRAANGNGTQRGVLDMSGLNNFTGNFSLIAVGSASFGGSANAQNATGTLKLAQTNQITTSFVGTPITSVVATPTNAIQIGADNGNAGGVDYFYLGQTNSFYIDSIGVGALKTTATMLFNAGLNNPMAYFRGVGGDSSRVRFWTIGDMASSGSSSSTTTGTNDFSGGTVDILVDTLSLGRDRQGGNTGSGVTRGTLTFTAGTVDANTVYDGNQQFTASGNSNPMSGVINVNGPTATLKANSTLYLGRTSVGSTAAKNTTGILNVTSGTVLANNVLVGTNSTGGSTTNFVTLINATLVVSNTLATNTTGLFSLNVSNSTIGLTVSANGSLKGLVQTLNSIGATNFIRLDPSPVIFTSYPQQFPLIKYTTWTGSNTFGLAAVPVWAPGAILVSNGLNSSLDLSLPTDPRPVFTAQPLAYSGSPGDNVTTNFAVTIAAGSVTPLGYQWYYVNGGVTNRLADGAGPSGSSTLTGSTANDLQIANAQPGDSGNYFVVVTNQFGTSTSSEALLTISGSAIAPTVTGPAAVTATNGITGTIAGSTSGSPVPVLYWQFNGTNLADGPGPSGVSTISGSAGSTLTIINPQYPGDQGTYSLIASNSAGLATNNTVLSVIVPPVITNQPASLVVTNTQAASFTVVAGGVPNPTYQWYKNTLANPISSALNPTATNATFAIASVSPSDAATYFVVVQNAAGSVTSGNVTLTVNSTMSTTTLMPANGATGVCYDTPLHITFSQTPTLRTAGKISIYNINNSATPVDTIDMSLGTLQTRTIAGENFANYPVIITGNTAAIYPHLDLLTSNQTYYVTIDDGVFADSTGAYFPGITTAGAWQFTTKAGGPADPANLVVAQDYSGDFATVQGALDSLPANNASLACINVRNGLYTEIVEFKKNNVVLRGQSRNGTIIGYANNSTLNASTHTRMAMKVNANNIALDNLTVTNSTQQDFSQAEALMVESGAAQIVVNNCNVDSYQDTILANISTSKAYFNNSLIQGDVDFIWGGGNLFFTNCEIRYLIRAGNGAALGPNPSPGASDIFSNGFSFVNCSLTTLPGANPNDTIGRTRSITNGNTALINCFVSTNIGGWSSDAIPTNNFRNWYYGCTNDLGASVTLSNGIPLSAGDPNVALASSATAWLYGWTPALSPNITTQPVSQSATAGQVVNFTAAATAVPDPTYQWFKNGTNVPGATGPMLTIASAQRSDGGTYYVVASNSSGSVTSSVVTLTYLNSAPVAPNFSVGALLGTPVAIQIIGGKYSPTDADGDPLTITGVTGATNGIVSTDGTNATYTATNGTGDVFTYTVSDGFGGTANATVTVFISSNIQGYNLLSASSLGNGTNILSFAGIPTYNYALDMATNLTPPINWMPQVTNPAANDGSLMYTNVSTLPQTFYRTRYAP